MNKGRILILEDDLDIANMLRIYFDSQGYEVLVAGRGGDALELCRKKLPHVAVLDIMLPDMDGYEVCKKLRSNLRTSHIPIMFLTQKDERSDKIAGMELGADDYITKPFDIEELKFRIQNAVARTTRESLTNPVTGLPSGKLIEEQFRLLMRKDGWAMLWIGIKDFGPFNEVYGFVAGDDVLRFTAMVVGEAVDELGTPDDFIGHTAANDLVVITKAGQAQAIKEKVTDRFATEVGTFYNFKHREQGYITVQDPEGQEKQVPLMTLAVGVITQDDGPFADIREITERAAEARRGNKEPVRRPRTHRQRRKRAAEARREDKELESPIQNAVVRTPRESLTHPVTGLPGGESVEKQLRRLLFMDGWAILYIGLNDFGPFCEVYGHVAGNDVLCFTATVTGEAVDELGAPDDFIGHTAANDFVVITTPKRAQAIKEKVKGRFAAEVGTFYKFKHREEGCGTVTEANEQEKLTPQRFPKWAPEGQNRTFDFWMPFRWLARILGRKSPEIKPASRSPLAISVPLMTLAVGIITQDDGPFADIREITERAAEARREDGRR